MIKHRPKTKYDEQAERFLAMNNLRMHIAFAGYVAPPWADEMPKPKKPLPNSRWSIVVFEMDPSFQIRRKVQFDFYTDTEPDSITGGQCTYPPVKPRPYDILACCGLEISIPETFSEFCAEAGFDFERCQAHAKKLRAFFKPKELLALSELGAVRTGESRKEIR